MMLPPGPHTISQAKHATADAGPATVIWECGAVLANFIVACEESGMGCLADGMSVRGAQVLELGAGTVCS
jgi:nitroreductase